MRKVILSLIILLIANTAFAGEFTRANETVTDSTNNLMWQDNAVVKTDKYTWEGAISYCEGLSHAGHDDWRLPTIIELSSIVDIDMFNPTIDGIFQNTANSAYWSSTTFAAQITSAWVTDFVGAENWSGSKDLPRYVRCVR